MSDFFAAVSGFKKTSPRPAKRSFDRRHFAPEFCTKNAVVNQARMHGSYVLNSGEKVGG
jgi:hypothetical protein